MFPSAALYVRPSTAEATKLPTNCAMSEIAARRSSSSFLRSSPTTDTVAVAEGS